MAAEDITLNELHAQMSELSLSTTACEEQGTTSLTLDATPQAATAPQKCRQQDTNLDKKDAAATPALDTIPAELLFRIDDCLDKTSALSLRLTSRRFREFFKYTANRNSTICTKKASRALRQLLIKDAVKAEGSGRVLVEDALEAAKEGKVHPGLMQPCFRCKAFQPIDCFSTEQLQKSPARRICLGHERGLRLCDHWFLTYFQLAKLPDGNPLQRHWSEWPESVPHNPFRCGCLLSSLSKCEIELPQSTSTLQPRPRPEQKGIRISSDTFCQAWNVPSGSDDELTDKQGVLWCIDSDKGMICPHLQAGTLYDYVTETTFSQPSEHQESEARKGIINGRCKAPHCGAKFSLHWKIGGSLEPLYEVYLEVSRQIEVFGMNGPEWLANTEVIDRWIENLAL